MKDDKIKTEKKYQKIPENFLICSPDKEYEAYVGQQIDQVLRFGDNEKAELYRHALERGLKVIANLVKEKTEPYGEA